MLDSPLDVLREEPAPFARRAALAASRTAFTARVWRFAIWFTYRAGRLTRWILVEGRAPVVVTTAVVGLVLSRDGVTWKAALVWLIGAFLILGPATLNARRRVMVGDFGGFSPVVADAQSSPPVDVGNLLQTELSRLGSLFRVVEDRRAVSSGLVSSAALDATISVDDVVSALQDTVSAETKITMGPLSVPVAPFMAVAGRMFGAPRLTGNLHQDADTLILTARQRGHSGLSWRVSRRTAPASGGPAEASGNANVAPEDANAAPMDAEPAAEEDAQLSSMVSELALRIFTDLALGRDVRWEASRHFVRGLDRFRAALRTPKDRKVRLRQAEEEFLLALSEDEDFPVVYYNLGVVYTELHGLAVAGGRRQEARMHLNAAEASFKWAIEKDPKRWETYLALAQTQFGDERYHAVLENCDWIRQLRRWWHFSARARAYDLRARALLHLAPGETRPAVQYARRATRASLWALIVAQLTRRAPPNGEGDHVPRCVELAGACTATYVLCYSKQMPSNRPGAVARRAESLLGLSEVLLASVAEIHFEFGLRLLNRGDFGAAERHLLAASQSDPKRSGYKAGRALVVLRRACAAGAPTADDVREVEEGCDAAVAGMAGVFAPSRDLDACWLVITVYEELAQATGSSDPARKARTLAKVARNVQKKLEHPGSEASVAALFLEELHEATPKWKGHLGGYGEATHQARRLLKSEARAALEPAERATSLNPLSSIAWETLGDVHNALQDFRSARKAWEAALSRDPDNPELYDKIGTSHWEIAFDGHSWVNTRELRTAENYFRSALLLYGSGSFDEQVGTHYRLGKLYTALGDFTEALPHLKIVEAVKKEPPIVGWQLLGLAHLRVRHFTECEYYFKRVISAGEALEDEGCKATAIVGDAADERLWPLGLVRAWGHLGVALSYAERDGNLSQASRQLALARKHAKTVDRPKKFPTRIGAACLDCEGYIRQRSDDLEGAISKFEEAVGEFPYSRAYLHLARAYMARARESDRNDNDLEAAERALAHAASLRPEESPTQEIEDARRELQTLAASTS